MLGPKMLARPAATVHQLDTKEIAAVLKTTVANDPHQLAVAVLYSEGRSDRKSTFYLKA
jgi:hypothetical protein